jgi:hypothetical protein
MPARSTSYVLSHFDRPIPHLLDGKSVSHLAACAGSLNHTLLCFVDSSIFGVFFGDPSPQSRVVRVGAVVSCAEVVVAGFLVTGLFRGRTEFPLMAQRARPELPLKSILLHV